MVYITAIHLEGGTRHEHIASVKWRQPDTGKQGDSTRAQMVEYLDDGGRAVVTDGRHQVDVHVVDAKPPYIRTHADGRWTNNLLALPRY